MIRSNSYDSIPATLKYLSQATLRGNKILKSDDPGKFQKIVPVHKESEAMSKLLGIQYHSLRRDYISGVIQKSRYVDNLKPIAEAVEANPGIVLPMEISLELKKYF